ncbi:Cleavage and polyadenylation specificity factor subunit 4 [Myotis brandtii]|uniref:Cleavage and polyadenylation specificity factor subunit 4 n=1 Tax=Myotis brandtii TaxID=109478 RepID=S7PBX1_MYOBR|nr:Cleavage and polyadenylation specificity factor subunit 4 [Myotis brandtii]
MTKMPECYFYSKFGPLCRHRHTRRVICVNYLVGFCPEGPSCKFMHPRFELPMGTTEQPPLPQQTQPPSKQSNNPPLQRSSSLLQSRSQNSSPNQQRAPQAIGVMRSQNSRAGNGGPRPLEQVTCDKVVKKDTTPTDAPKGTWPFSVDSDSSWRQLRTAQRAPFRGPLWAILGIVHLTVQCQC